VEERIPKLRLGVLASGRGSNFQSIIDAVDNKTLKAEIVLLITDNPAAFAIERAKKRGIEYLVIRPKEFSSRDEFYEKVSGEFQSRGVDLVILAGFMRIIRKPFIDAFPNRIMNIHPALLPAFRGLHGQKQALEHGVKIAGCTVHFVDEGMDTGPIIIQAAVPVYPDDTEETLSERILKLEHKIYPEAIRLFSEGRLEVDGRTVKIKEDVPSEQSVVNPCLRESI
jgi:phosphoribosylglycinamide formyltransferase-1